MNKTGSSECSIISTDLPIAFFTLLICSPPFPIASPISPFLITKRSLLFSVSSKQSFACAPVIFSNNAMYLIPSMLNLTSLIHSPLKRVFRNPPAPEPQKLELRTAFHMQSQDHTRFRDSLSQVLLLIQCLFFQDNSMIKQQPAPFHFLRHQWPALCL